ncbi:MAG: ABC transporter transmembrane domain-containing protein, partial [Anaerolineae bacterium]
MIRLARYLKPFTLLIVLSIILLFTQAMADLSLPDYLSRIVNNGIQQNGVESAVPQAIRQTEMDRVTLFMSEDDKTTVLDHYTLINQDSADYERYVTDYPTLATEPIYVLNDATSSDVDVLKPIMSKAMIAVSGIEQAMTDPTKAAALSSGGFDLSKLPAGTDVFAMIGVLPAAIRTNMLNSMSERFAVMGESMVEQGAISAVKNEYEALGVDTSALQTNYIVRTGAIMLAISLLSGLATIMVGFLSARAAAGMAMNLRRDVFTKVTSFSNFEFDKFSVSSLITRSTNDITQLQMLVVIMIRMLIYAPILAVGGIIKAVSTDASMWWT